MQYPAGRTRILVADPRPMSTLGMAKLLGKTTGMSACSRCHSLAELPTALSTSDADLVVIDIELYENDAEATVGALREIQASVAILLLVVHVNDLLLRALADPNVSCISPYSPPDLLISAIRSLAAGHRALPFEVQEALAAKLAAHSSRPSSLTPREHQIFELAAQGLTVSAIAATLHISPSTAKTHLRRGYEKLHAKNRSAAVAAALHYGILRLNGAGDGCSSTILPEVISSAPA